MSFFQEIPFFFPLGFILFGVFLCVWGYSAFKFSLIIMSFTVGLVAVMYLGSHFIADQNLLIIIGIAVGIFLGIIMLLFYYGGIFFAGVVGGLVLLYMINLDFSSFQMMIFAIIICVVCGFIALLFQRIAITLVTSVIGSFCVVHGIGFLWYVSTKSVVSFNTYLEFVQKSDSIYYAVLLVIAIVAVCGVIFQLRLIPEAAPNNNAEE